MLEISPGVWHWTALHPGIGAEVSSYFLSEERVLIDPLIPAEGLSWFAEARPEHALLTSRHHDRQAWQFRAEFGCRIHCGADARAELRGRGPVEVFAFGDRLPGDVTAMEVGAIFPEETAFHIPRHRALACGDGVIRAGARPGLRFVPDQYMEDPAETKTALRRAYRALLELDFDTLLLAHGDPMIDAGKAALAGFVAGSTP
jgi:glyoxylase-like metal-dependent hydrolase (beta-lactamase superfamily II)